MKHTPIISAFLLVLLSTSALALRSPSMAEEFSYNQAAKAAISDCGGANTSVATIQAVVPEGYRLDRTAWLQVMKARCTATVDEPAAIREALAASDSRFSSLHAMAPHDASLARFAAATYPKRAEAHFWLGDALLRQGDIQEASEAYERGLSLQGSDGDAWLALGYLYARKGDTQGAVRAFDQACHLGDEGSNGCGEAGAIYLRLGQYELAAERYQASIKQIGRPWPPSEEGLVTALLALGRTSEAIPHLAVLAADGSVEAQQKLEQLQGSHGPSK